MKLDQLVHDLKKDNFLDSAQDVSCYFLMILFMSYFSNNVIITIEFQDRGLPHAHILLWVERKDKNMTTGEIDNIISGEIVCMMGRSAQRNSQKAFLTKLLLMETDILCTEDVILGSPLIKMERP